MSEWQDISTAPKDGTAVLAVDDEGQYHVVWWQHGSWVRAGDDYNLWVLPTHWQPLPPFQIQDQTKP